MTIPGEPERAAIKVVPIYLDPVVETIEVPAEAPASVVEEPAPDAPAPRSGVLGGLALLLALATSILTAIGVSVASSGGFDVGAALAWAAIVTSGLSVLAGLVATIFRLGRGMGIAAMVIGVISNPWLLATVLGFFAPV
ncbi:hypothetical protein M2152_002204 [Microbacteriaceae bacterium SG_E_30_P1]|uniref:Uncharacterized protein n=1 Tax=Antiquaquibacter oligotrophicus TaxID=2880260 RepID=A0ABT6KSG9_9MICO|nr:hypothetical protein [Antiquaquibacter oligotrophicus]MDH6182022.1 hypothetical protein [Antiquaquibacter oligotrophicus]UDF12310.1 hypothetical protein LH407_09050 [Antiquaquibacter oligotrophicus]